MAIFDFFLSRNNAVSNTAAYVGHNGRMFYDSVDRVLRISDGTTPGGQLVTYPVATETVLGGIKAGPGANVSVDGTLTIDTTGLPLSFGNFTANNNILTLVNVDEDMILETSGNAEIQLIGNVGFYKPNGGGVPDPDALFFFARDDGQLTILVPAEDPLLGAVEIIGSATGRLIPPGSAGAMLHITGNPALPARVYLDGNNEYASFVARRFNGNVAVPTQVLAGQDVFRINSTAATNAGMGNVAMAQIRTTALENQTTTAQGSSITFTVTPVGSPASARVDVANVTVADGVTATKFTTTGNVSAGNVTATNYTGKVTHSIRDAGAVGGTTLTLNVTTDDIVRCTFTSDFTVAFSNIVAGRVITLIATNTSGADSDVITSGVAALNTTSAGTFTVTQQTTAVVTYYSLDGDAANIYASAVYA
jgi:hypothetical protein